MARLCVGASPGPRGGRLFRIGTTACRRPLETGHALPRRKRSSTEPLARARSGSWPSRVRRAAERLERVKHKLANDPAGGRRPGRSDPHPYLGDHRPPSAGGRRRPLAHRHLRPPRDHRQRHPQVERAAAQHDPGASRRRPARPSPPGPSACSTPPPTTPGPPTTRSPSGTRPMARRSNQRQHAGRQASGDQLRRRTRRSATPPTGSLLDLFPPRHLPDPACCPHAGTRPPTRSCGAHDPVDTTPASHRHRGHPGRGRATSPPRPCSTSGTATAPTSSAAVLPDNTAYHADEHVEQRATHTRHWQPLCVLTATGVAAGQPPVPTRATCPDAAAQVLHVQKPLTPAVEEHHPVRAAGPGDPLPAAVPAPRAAEAPTARRHRGHRLGADDLQPLRRPKVKAEYWADGPKSEFPPGHMAVFAQALLADAEEHPRPGRQAVLRARQRADGREHLVLGGQVPVRLLAADHRHPGALPGQAGHLLAGPEQGLREGPRPELAAVPGSSTWSPRHSPSTCPGTARSAPPAAPCSAAFYGNDDFNAKVTIKAGSSQIEPGVTPAKDVVLSWKTLSDAADEAGWSRRYGGIHF